MGVVDWEFSSDRVSGKQARLAQRKI